MGQVNGAINCFQDISDRKQAEERQLQLVEELRHRIKNTLATVHSMAVNTARDASSIPEFTSRFEARLLALGQAHALIGDCRQAGAKLRDLLAQQLEPFGGRESSRVRFDGPDIDLDSRPALALCMVFHELMTNAAKYGPLSVAQGQISVEWDLLPVSDGDRTLIIRWVEMDGPPVKAPKRTGFGTRLIKRTIGSLNGQTNLLFEPSGLQLWMSIPLQE